MLSTSQCGNGTIRSPHHAQIQKSPQITVCPRIGKITCFCCDPALMHFVLFSSKLPVNVERLQVPTQLATAGACLSKACGMFSAEELDHFTLHYDFIHNKTHSFCVWLWPHCKVLWISECFCRMFWQFLWSNSSRRSQIIVPNSPEIYF